MIFDTNKLSKTLKLGIIHSKLQLIIEPEIQSNRESISIKRPQTNFHSTENPFSCYRHQDDAWLRLGLNKYALLNEGDNLKREEAARIKCQIFPRFY